MPSGELTRVVKSYRESVDLLYADIAVDSEPGRALIERVMGEFQVSKEAARVRMESSSVKTIELELKLFTQKDRNSASEDCGRLFRAQRMNDEAAA